METLKDGVRTSEFWITIISMVINFGIFAVFVTSDGNNVLLAIAAVVSSSLASLAYGGGRVYLKK